MPVCSDEVMHGTMAADGKAIFDRSQEISKQALSDKTVIQLNITTHLYYLLPIHMETIKGLSLATVAPN